MFVGVNIYPYIRYHMQTFYQDLERGKQIEKNVLDMIHTKYPKAYMQEGYFKEWDIYVPEKNIAVEVKLDEMSQETGNIVIEVTFDGKPSALSTTKADYWVIWDGIEYKWFYPEDIKKCIQDNCLKLVTFTAKGDVKSKQAYLIKKQILYRYSIQPSPSTEMLISS